MIADEPTPRAKTIEQVAGAVRSFEIALGWTIEDMCVAYLVEANHISPTATRDLLTHQWRRLAELLVALHIEV